MTMPKILVTYRIIQNLLSDRYGQDDKPLGFWVHVPPRASSGPSFILQRIEAGNLDYILVMPNAKLVAGGAQSSAHSRRKDINPRLKDWEMAKGNVHSLHRSAVQLRKTGMLWMAVWPCDWHGYHRTVCLTWLKYCPMQVVKVKCTLMARYIL